MRVFLFLVLSSGLVLGGYWVFAAQMIERQVASYLANSSRLFGTAGSVTGFPLGFSLRITAPQWHSRDTQIAWRASDLTLRAPSYQPNHITAEFPTHQILRLGAVETDVRTEQMRAMLTVSAARHLRSAALDLQEARFSQALGITSLARSQIRLQHLDDTRYALQTEIRGVGIAVDLLDQVALGASPTATMIDAFHLEATADFATALQIDAPLPEVMALDVTDARLDWGDLRLSAVGRLDRSATGFIEGSLRLQIEDWRPLLALLQHSGILPQDMAMMAAMFFASQSDPETGQLTLPLELRASQVFLGPFPVLQLPAF